LHNTRGQDEEIGAILGAAGGGLIGLLIGGTSHGGHWVPVETAGIQVALGPGRLGLQVSF
jgi:hypothetical protein